MPNPKQRKTNSTAQQRINEKYLNIPSDQHPHNLWPARKEDTATFRQVMETRNFIRIVTQVDTNRYIVAQYYVYCDEDIWCCGDAAVLNVNPDKKILVQALCVKTRRECPAFEEGSREFLTVCAKCGAVGTAVKDTLWECKHCDFQVDYKMINDAPYLKLPCEYCPVVLGWEKVISLAQSNPQFFKKYLRVRAHIYQKITENKFTSLNDQIKEMTDEQP